jgi:hypothetical protein
MRVLCAGVELTHAAALIRARSFVPATDKYHVMPVIETPESNEQIRIQLATRHALANMAQHDHVVVICKTELETGGKRRHDESQTHVYSVVSKK